ncbi:MAG: rhodanese-like domain-containing protein [Halioglobus sp.]
MLKSLPELIAETTAHIRTVDAKTAKAERALNNGFLIDVREPAEADVKSAVGSTNIPRGILEMKITGVCTDVDTPIYLHCASSGRARLATEQLLRMGYQNVTAISCDIDKVCRAFQDD